MGGNVWKAAPSISAMSNRTLRLYLSDSPSGANYELTARKLTTAGILKQTVDFSDRDEAATNNLYPAGVVTKDLRLKNGFTFISKPACLQRSLR
jgi:hypothetical protein